MKQFLKYILIGLGLLSVTLSADAQEVLSQYHEAGGVATKKDVGTQNQDGSYTISLETFATGSSAFVETSTPADIVLVLDVSGSMEDPLYTYTERASQDYSYSSVSNNSSYYYLHSNGKYYQVKRYRTSYNNYNNCYLCFIDDNNTRWFLYGSGEPSTDEPQSVRGQYTTIWSGVLYSKESSESKMAALRSAVKGFIKEVYDNAWTDSQGNKRTTPVDHQISIVKFAGKSYSNDNVEGNDTYREDGYTYNYTQIVKQFTPVSSKKSDLDKAIDGLNEGGATSVDYGLTKAKTLLDKQKSERDKQKIESSKIVVMFTDGQPTHSSGFVYSVAKAAVDKAQEIKDMGAIVYTIGVFDDETDDIRDYMDHVSSNYPNTTAEVTYNYYDQENGINYSGNKISQAKAIYYQNASGSNLSSIFKSIASAASQTDEAIGIKTEVRDVVSSSFAIAFPSNVTTATQKQTWVEQNVKVYTSDISEDGKSWGDLVDYNGATITYVVETDDDGVEYDAIRVKGFDYTYPDVEDEDGYVVTAGNWVGLRYTSKTTSKYAGKKLVIQFNVNIEDGITGGITGTNTRTSGVYLYNEETKKYECINYYDVPNKVLSVTIRIAKTGLRGGESATFLIKKAEPLKDANGNIVYNAIGKPEPDPDTWITEHKVILTNKTTSKETVVTKTLYGLDPNYVYEVVEDDWGWAYEMSGSGETMTTSDVIFNPFRFTNTEKTTINGQPIRKHAEAVTINHFGYTIPGTNKQEEHYKSSKVNTDEF